MCGDPPPRPFYKYHRLSALQNGSAVSYPSVGPYASIAIPARSVTAADTADKGIPVGVGAWRGAAQHFVFPDAVQQESLVIDVQAPGAAHLADPADPAPGG